MTQQGTVGEATLEDLSLKLDGLQLVNHPENQGLELLLEKHVKACNLQENTYSAFKLKIKNLLLL